MDAVVISNNVVSNSRVNRKGFEGNGRDRTGGTVLSSCM